MVRLFNDAHFASPKQNESLSKIGSFHQFPMLPKEIRLHVWSLALQPRPRFISIRINLPTLDQTEIHHKQSHLYSTRNDMGNIISGISYELAINGSDTNHTICPIFSTSKESRWVALDYFRLRLPLAGNSHIRVNPDYDVLFFHTAYGAYEICDINMLAAILHDIRAYDPKDQGLMHLAIQGDTLFPEQPFTGRVGRGGLHRTVGSMSNGSAGKIGLSHPIAQASLIDILSTKLRTLWCVQNLNNTKARVHGPTRDDITALAPQWMETVPMLPPMSTLGISYLNFEWFKNDPRPVELDIHSMPFLRDPRRYYHTWKVIEEALGVTHATPFRVYVCVTSEIAPAEIWRRGVQPTGEKPGLHQLVESNRQIEKREWETTVDHWVDVWNEIYPFHGNKFDELAYREEMAMPADRDDVTAIGMWLFPEEAFGQVNDNFAEVDNMYRLAIKSSVTPGLALFDLSFLPL